MYISVVTVLKNIIQVCVYSAMLRWFMKCALLIKLVCEYNNDKVHVLMKTKFLIFSPD